MLALLLKRLIREKEIMILKEPFQGLYIQAGYLTSGVNRINSFL